jgi:hypothetical protein
MAEPKSKKKPIYDGRRRSYDGQTLSRNIKRRFKFKVESNGVLENPETIAWMRETFGKELFYCSDYNDDRYIDCYTFKKDAVWDAYDGTTYFKNEKDAMLFKLFWIK